MKEEMKARRVGGGSIFVFVGGQARADKPVKPKHMYRIIVTIAAMLGVAVHANGEPARDKSGKSGELYDTIARLDASLFDAFNKHDAEGLMKMFTADLEFFDDGDGLSDFQKTKNDFKNLFASAPDIRRDLVAGTLEVYPIKGYGAIQIGVHRFCHKENGKDDCGSFKFAMVWRKSGEVWQISRVLSYGH